MKEEFAIKVNGISKNYKIGSGIHSFDANLSEFIIRKIKSLFKADSKTDKKEKINNIWALDGITFNVKHGEKLGIIGKNGAGKSSLLKIISRITYPDKGRIELNGRVASLLEVGTGFHPDLTGRENIYLNGTLLGMTKKEVDKNLVQIIDFSGVDLFLDTPIKKYSSGMKVRLAFAVAAHLKSEILIIDEVLAVGDAAFQQKCIGKMNEVAREGRTVLFVSHNMAALRNFCDRAIYLKNGKVECDGNVEEVIRQYLGENLSGEVILNKEQLEVLAEKTPSGIYSKANLIHLSIMGEDFKTRKNFYSDEEIFICIGIEVQSVINDLRVVVSLVDEENNNLLVSQVSDSELFLKENLQISAGQYNAVCTIPANMLGDNEYYVTIKLINPFIEEQVFTKVLSFKVKYKGFNNIQMYSFGNAVLRPKLNWTFSVADNKKTGIKEKTAGSRLISN